LGRKSPEEIKKLRALKKATHLTQKACLKVSQKAEMIKADIMHSDLELCKIANESLAMAAKSSRIAPKLKSLSFTEVGSVKVGNASLRFAALKTSDNFA